VKVYRFFSSKVLQGILFLGLRFSTEQSLNGTFGVDTSGPNPPGIPTGWLVVVDRIRLKLEMNNECTSSNLYMDGYEMEGWGNETLSAGVKESDSEFS
jgi:hypothetical protein